MLPVRVLALPGLLMPGSLAGRTAVVFDVLRATTTMAAAIAASVAKIEAFDSLDAARAAAAAFTGDKLLAGEQHTLRPPDFDLGNSPADFTADRCASKTIFMATTNGTRALVAARAADVLLTGAIVNAAATADAVRRAGLPVTLIGSGTQGEVSLEDLIGCGAVMAHLGEIDFQNDTARLALMAWQSAKSDLPAVFRGTYSGHNLNAAGLLTDVDFCCDVDRFGVACRVETAGPSLVVLRTDDAPHLSGPETQ